MSATLGAAVGAALAGAVLATGVAATDGAADGAGVAGATVGALVAAEEQADRVMAATASAVAAVRNERMQDLLQEHAELFDVGSLPGDSPLTRRGCSVAPRLANAYLLTRPAIMASGRP